MVPFLREKGLCDGLVSRDAPEVCSHSVNNDLVSVWIQLRPIQQRDFF